MIDIKGKATNLGVIEAVEAAGIAIWQESDGWYSTNDEAAQAIIDSFTEEDAQAWARQFIQPVTRRQMLTALHRFGLLETIKSAVASSGDVELQIAFDEAQDFERQNPFLATMAAALGKTDAEIDAVFALAATI